MSQKIMNIKNILKIIISIFIIFSLIKSCSNAWTVDDFFDYTEQLKEDSTVPTNIKNLTQKILNNETTIRSRIQQYAPNSTSFMVGINSVNNLYYSIFLDNKTLNLTINNGGIYLTTSIGKIVTDGVGQNRWSSGSSNGQYAYDRCYGLVDTNSNIPSTYYFNKYEPPPILNYTPYYDTKELTINNITNVYGQQLQWTVGTRLGKITNYYEIDTNLLSYNLKNYKTQEEIPIELQFVDRETMVIKVISNSSVFKNQLYDLTLTYDEQEKHYYYYLYGTDVNIVNGQTIITNFSGDSDYNIQNATNDNQKFTEKIIDDLFNINQTEVQEIIENIKDNVHVENLGMVSGETQILNILKGEPSDFVISWNSTEYMGREIIPAGQINFSERIRQTPQLETVVNWARIIIGYATISVLIMEIWFTLCRILGISISFYEQQHDEIDSISEYTNDFYDTDTGILTRDIVKKRKGYVQTLRQRKDFNPKNRKR